jgi:hypothetical protein
MRGPSLAFVLGQSPCRRISLVASGAIVNEPRNAVRLQRRRRYLSFTRTTRKSRLSRSASSARNDSRDKTETVPVVESSADRRRSVDDVRCPNIAGLPADTVHTLHHSFVDIVQMRRSIESADLAVNSGRKAVKEGLILLEHLKAHGF